MQIDCHYGAIYALSRLAGIKSEFAEIIAYASQQVDDATHGHVLRFKNTGGVFRQTLTAHRKLDLRSLNMRYQLETWMPFHFLPGAEGKTTGEKLICHADSKPAEAMLKEVSRGNIPVSRLHLLGIVLHAYVDTFTHQLFKGFTDSYNEVSVTSKTERRRKKNIFSRIFKKVTRVFTRAVSPVGHVRAGTMPDIPYLEWEIERMQDGKRIKINNLNDRFLPAMKRIYSYLGEFLKFNPEFGKVSEQSELSGRWQERKKLITNLLNQRIDEGKDRLKGWINAIRKGEFCRDGEKPDEIDLNLNYDDRKWFREAVEVVIKRRGKEEYISRKGFETSNWRLFHQAASWHKHFVIHKLLPGFGIITG